MIAASAPIIISIWALSTGLVITAFHLRWMNRQMLKLSERVFHLEMERDFPGFSRWRTQPFGEELADDTHDPQGGDGAEGGPE